MSNRPQIAVEVPVDTLQDIRGWVAHWEEDARCGLPPTPSSLGLVRDLLRSALEQPRVFPTLQAAE